MLNERPYSGGGWGDPADEWRIATWAERAQPYEYYETRPHSVFFASDMLAIRCTSEEGREDQWLLLRRIGDTYQAFRNPDDTEAVAFLSLRAVQLQVELITETICDLVMPELGHSVRQKFPGRNPVLFRPRTRPYAARGVY